MGIGRRGTGGCSGRDVVVIFCCAPPPVSRPSPEDFGLFPVSLHFLPFFLF